MTSEKILPALKRHVYAVEGILCAGKSSFLRQFAAMHWKDDVEVCFEPLTEWRNYHGKNMLDEMYRHPSMSTFPFQCLVLQTMARRLCQPQVVPIRLTERSMYSARHCFIQIARDNHHLTEEQYNLLHDMEALLTDLVPSATPDAIIYLRIQPRQALERLRKRQRDEELSYELSDMTQLYDKYEEWLSHAKRRTDCPVITIDVTENPDEMSRIFASTVGQLKIA